MAADGSIEELLESWGLYNDLGETFKENCIDLEALSLLSDEDIKQLIPKVGLRVKFTNYLKKQNKPQDVQMTTFPVTLDFGSPDLSDIDSPQWESFNSDVSVSSQDEVLSRQSTVSPASIASMSSSSQASASSFLPASQMPALKRKRTVLFDALVILNQTTAGKNVIKQINSQGFLSKKVRHTLVTILVSHLAETCGKNPSSFEKSALAQSIITAFPQLKDPQGISGYEAFYSKGASRCPASGYLEEHLRYVRKQMLMKSKTEKESPTAGPQINPERTNDIKEKISWLKENIEPRDEVMKLMTETSEYRQNWIKCSNRSVAEIIAEFPRLLDDGMIEHDFKFKYPDKASNLTDRWPHLVPIIIDYGTQQIPFWRDALGLIDIGELDALPEEQRTNLAIFMIPLILKGHNKKTSAGRVTYREAQEVFIDTQLEILNVPEYTRNIDVDTRSQPFVLSLHHSLDDKLQPKSVFVIVEKKVIAMPSLLGALDLCYKLHYVLDCEFQSKCGPFLRVLFSSKVVAKGLRSQVHSGRCVPTSHLRRDK